ncbi:MAG: class I SAM-dependent methyltransferase [Candidatus Altiarchaeota archaeon]|nr:class I SAM-dependent methyltransferase [Candidatus Altiarchaeota archaeon]
MVEADPIDEIGMATPKTMGIVISLLKKDKIKKVLDVGAGKGQLSKKLRSEGYDVYACDLNTEQYPYENCVYADLDEKLPYSREQFDCLIAEEVIEHLENPSFTLRELNRILKIGGVLILTTPNILSIFSRMLFLVSGRFHHFNENTYFSIGHKTPLPAWLLSHILESSGFKIDCITYNQSYIPLLRIGFDWKTQLMGQTLIIKARKMKADEIKITPGEARENIKSLEKVKQSYS